MKLLRILPIVLAALSAAVLAQSGAIEVCEEARDLGYRSVHAGPDGWLFAGSDFESSYDLQGARPYLERLVAELAERDILLVAVVLPTRAMVYGDLAHTTPEEFSLPDARRAHDAAVAELNELGVVTPNLLPAYLEERDSELLFFKRDHHWTPAGARLAAQLVREALSDHPETVASWHTKEFETLSLGMVPASDNRVRDLRELCGSEIPREQFEGWTTTTTAEEDLFAELPDPEVVLVGTSNSYRRNELLLYNFDGFLAEYLQTDVLNYGVPAGGTFTSLRAYLLSEEYRESKPSVIVWEFNFSQLDSLADEAEFRQLIPSIDGPCTVEESLIHRVVPAGASEFPLLFNRPGLPIAGSDYYLYFEASNPTWVELGLSIRYEEGSESISLERSTRTANSGSFFMEFAGSAESPFASAWLSVPEGTGIVDARVCRKG